MSVVYAQGPPGGLIRCWRLGVSSFYFEKHRRKPFCESSTDLTQLDRPRHIFLTAEMRSCHFFFPREVRGWNFLFSSSFFSLSRSLSLCGGNRGRTLTMREKETGFPARSFSSGVHFLLLLADVVLTHFRCFSTHFRYAKSNLLVSRRAVGAHWR